MVSLNIINGLQGLFCIRKNLVKPHVCMYTDKEYYDIIPKAYNLGGGGVVLAWTYAQGTFTLELIDHTHMNN